MGSKGRATLGCAGSDGSHGDRLGRPAPGWRRLLQIGCLQRERSLRMLSALPVY